MVAGLSWPCCLTCDPTRSVGPCTRSTQGDPPRWVTSCWSSWNMKMPTRLWICSIGASEPMKPAGEHRHEGVDLELGRLTAQGVLRARPRPERSECHGCSGLWQAQRGSSHRRPGSRAPRAARWVRSGSRRGFALCARYTRPRRDYGDPEPLPFEPLGRERLSGSFRNEPALLLSQRRIEVEHEGVRIGPELGHDEGHPLGHQPGDKGDVARQTIEFETTTGHFALRAARNAAAS